MKNRYLEKINNKMVQILKLPLTNLIKILI